MFVQHLNLIALILFTSLLSACGMHINNLHGYTPEQTVSSSVVEERYQDNLTVSTINSPDLIAEIQRLETRLSIAETEHNIASQQYDQAQELAREYAITIDEMRKHRIRFNESSTTLYATKASLLRVKAYANPNMNIASVALQF